MTILKPIVDCNEANSNVCEDGFNFDKFKQVLHYIIHKTGGIDTVGKTVLFKLLYFNDFNYYEMFEEKMTGESYRKIEHGPAPCHFDEAISDLEDDDKIESTTRPVGTYTQKKFISECKPDFSLLSGNEIHSIDDTIARYSNWNATQISALSHDDVPYDATENKAIIDYELVFYRDPMFSVREYENGDDC
ncbi:MAG: Panacea domain-containing protein [Methanosarcinaceae archaeon]